MGRFAWIYDLTGHQEITGSLASSRRFPPWVPVVDGWGVFAGMFYAVKGFHGFE